MPIQRLIIVQPCYSLEDLPRNLDADTAEDYHACWTALWHPAFLSVVDCLPEWKRSDSSSLDVKNSLIMVPAASASHIDTTLRERMDLNENLVVTTEGNRVANVRTIAMHLQNEQQIAFEIFDDSESLAEANSTNQRTPICVRTFYALGYAYQQLHILTRKVHYSTNLDLLLFQEQVAKAAKFFCDGDLESAEQWLQSAFDQLSQERDRYFSQQANLIDITLLAQSTLGESLTKQLGQSHAQNILASASLLEQLQARNSSALATLKHRVEAKDCSVIGGFDREPASPWLSTGHQLRSLAAGRHAYAKLGIRSPSVFARLSGGLQPHDSQMLRISGFQYAVISTWLDGELPRSDQAKIRWQSTDSTTIDAIAAFVLEADSTLSILSVAVELAKQFDYHQVPTLLLAHWPNKLCHAFHDLRLATERTAALGKWQTLDAYFEGTGQAYSNTLLPISHFKFALPEDRLQYHEFCRAWMDAAKTSLQADSLKSFGVLVSELADWMSRKPLQEECNAQSTVHQTLMSQCDQALAARVDAFRSELARRALGEASSLNASTLNDELEDAWNALGRIFGSLMSGKAIEDKPSAIKILQHAVHERPLLSRVVALKDAKHLLVYNPQSVPMRFFLRTGNSRLTCNDATRVYAEENSSSTRRLLQSGVLGKVPDELMGGHEVIVDVPAMGVVQLDQSSGASLSSMVAKKSNLASSSATFGNEYLDVQLDPNSGNIRAMLVNRKRGSRMSGQLSILDPAKLVGIEPANPANRYAEARKVTLAIEHNSTTSAVISAKGVLAYERTDLAEFEILYEIWRGSRLLQITPRLRWLIETKSEDVWSGAPVWRTAWPSEAASITGWQQNIPTKVTTATFFSPQFIEVDDAEHKLYLMMSGANMHRRRELRYMDTHLGDGAMASLLVGLDVPHPAQQWSSWIQGPRFIANHHPMPANQTTASFVTSSQRGLSIEMIPPAMYFADAESLIDSANVSASEAGSPSKPPLDFDAYFLVQETLAKSSSAQLVFFRDVKSAAKVNCFGQSDEQLEIVDGTPSLKLRSCETVLVGVNWG